MRRPIKPYLPCKPGNSWPTESDCFDAYIELSVPFQISQLEINGFQSQKVQIKVYTNLLKPDTQTLIRYKRNHNYINTPTTLVNIGEFQSLHDITARADSHGFPMSHFSILVCTIVATKSLSREGH